MFASASERLAQACRAYRFAADCQKQFASLFRDAGEGTRTCDLPLTGACESRGFPSTSVRRRGHAQRYAPALEMR